MRELVLLDKLNKLSNVLDVQKAQTPPLKNESD